jgi:hypothetical protein
MNWTFFNEMKCRLTIFFYHLLIGPEHKVLTYIEYRAVSGVFQNIEPPTLFHPASVSSPRTKGGGVHTRRAVRGWGVNILEDARHRMGLLQYNLFTDLRIRTSLDAGKYRFIIYRRLCSQGLAELDFPRRGKTQLGRRGSEGGEYLLKIWAWRGPSGKCLPKTAARRTEHELSKSLVSRAKQKSG